MDLSPLSCETCRNKKRKCNRSLPSCSQCTSSEMECVYPESGKRGIPSGYIARLEKRLAETEVALLMRLVDEHTFEDPGGSAPQNRFDAARRTPDHDSNETRHARIQEWDKFPLENWYQQRDWYRHWLRSRGQKPPKDPRTERSVVFNPELKRKRSPSDEGAADSRENSEDTGAGTCVAQPQDEENTASSLSSKVAQELVDEQQPSIRDSTSGLPLIPISLRAEASDSGKNPFPTKDDTLQGIVLPDINVKDGGKEHEQASSSKAARLKDLQPRHYF